MAAAVTKAKFEGETRGLCGGGNSVNTKYGTEKHDGPYAKGKRVQVSSSPSEETKA
jgi:hypothetical protein